MPSAALRLGKAAASDAAAVAAADDIALAEQRLYERDAADPVLSAKEKADRAAKREADQLARPIGAYAKGLVARSAHGTKLFLGRPGSREIIDLQAFAKVSSSGCAADWCSRHSAPWLLCDKADTPGHETKTSGAHAVPRTFKKTVLPTLLLLAASLPGAAPSALPLAADASWRSAATLSSARAPPRPAASVLFASGSVGSLVGSHVTLDPLVASGEAPPLWTPPAFSTPAFAAAGAAQALPCSPLPAIRPPASASPEPPPPPLGFAPPVTSSGSTHEYGVPMLTLGSVAQRTCTCPSPLRMASSALAPLLARRCGSSARSAV